MVREHHIKQLLDYFSPRDYFRDYRMKWMVRPSERQFEERASFVDVSGQRPGPKTRRPTLGLKPGMKLADVVQKHQRGQSLTSQWRHRRTGCGAEAIPDNRELQHPQEHGSNVH